MDRVSEQRLERWERQIEKERKNIDAHRQDPENNPEPAIGVNMATLENLIAEIREYRATK